MQIGNMHRYPSHLAVNDIAKAVDILMGGKTVYLQAYGSNLTTVKEHLRVAGITV